MDNSNAFTVYALILIAGVASVITASVAAGVTTLPSMLVFAEHVGLSLLFRAAYKSFGGWTTGFESLYPAAPGAEAIEAAEPAHGPTADAMG